MNLPNKLTISRLVLTVFFVVCFSIPLKGHFILALLFFFIAILTDYLDGMTARRHGLTSDFGKLMDPLADKILTTAAFVCLCGIGKIPAWAVIIIVSREFLITGLRSLAATKGIIFQAERLGKHKTGWQMVTIFYFLLLLSISEYTNAHWVDAAWTIGTYGLIPITIALTVYSGIAYLAKHWDLIEKS